MNLLRGFGCRHVLDLSPGSIKVFFRIDSPPGSARSALLHGEAAGRGVRAARSNGEAERWDGLQREREAAGGAVGRLPQPLLLVRELARLRVDHLVWRHATPTPDDRRMIGECPITKRFL